MNTGVYQIRHVASGKVYVGSAVNFSDRWNAHRGQLTRGVHHNERLQRAWIKYGAGQFTFEKLLVCRAEDLLLYEQLAIDQFCQGGASYNICLQAGSTLGTRRSQDTRDKISKSNKGKVRSEEARLRISEAFRGRVQSPQARAKVSEALRKRVRTAETGRKISEATKITWEKTKEKRIQTPEKCKKISDSMKEVWRLRLLAKQQKDQPATD